jgi:acid phosphatase type 7
MRLYPRLLPAVLVAVLVFGVTAAAMLGQQSEDQVVMAGAGDIAGCDWDSDEATATLLDDIDGTVFTLGDHAYPNGTAEQFAECYEPTWGRHKDRTRPAPGSHDYESEGGAPYFRYFGDAAGDPARGYYSYPAGDHWHVIVLNSECDEIGGCDEGSPQAQWLEAELASNEDKHVLAYWHRPRFSSGTSGNDPRTQTFWDLLHAHGAELVLNGHEHAYERFGRQDPQASGDPDGIRQFIVGTGGALLYPMDERQPNSEVFDASSHGVLKLTLRPSSYSWEFVPVDGATFTDSGTTETRRR